MSLQLVEEEELKLEYTSHVIFCPCGHMLSGTLKRRDSEKGKAITGTCKCCEEYYVFTEEDADYKKIIEYNTT